MSGVGKYALPCLRGAIGDWVYYCAVIPFSEVHRIDTKHRIKEDADLDRRLQRHLKERVEGIKNYLLKEDERFFNSIVVGLYGEAPDWYALNLTPIAEQFRIAIPKRVQESLGVLELSGQEVLFTVDGQHRIEGIKRAMEKNPKRFENDEVAVLFVGHAADERGYVRTRKLFATINREAQKPTKNDLAIIDETYAYNIVARMLYASYQPLKNRIALTDNYNLERSDKESFTNLLTLVEVNKKLFKAVKHRDNKYQSPTLVKRTELFNVASEFYDFIFKNIETYRQYILGKKGISNYRNAEPKKPLNLLFLPIGLGLVADVYGYLSVKKRLAALESNINKVNFDLYRGAFAGVFFSPVQNRIITRNKVLGRDLLLHMLGEFEADRVPELKERYAKALNINVLSPEFNKLVLPSPVV